MMKGSLLVVDDDPAVHELMGHLFPAPEYRLHRAETLERARDLLAVVDVDLAVIDGALPDGSGIDLIRELRAAGRDVRVVFFSAHYRDAQTRQTLLEDLRVSLVTHKPVIPSELRIQLDELLAGARRSRQRRAEQAPAPPSAREVVRAKLASMRHGYGLRLRARLDRLAERLRDARDGQDADGVLRDLYTEVHNVHGTAGTLNLGGVGAAAGRAEDVLRPVLDRTRPRNDQFWEGLFTALDRMRLALDTALGERTPPTVVRPVTLKIPGVAEASLRVLLVTEDEALRTRVETWSPDLQVVPTCFADPDAALEQAAQERFHGAIVDGDLGTSGESYRLVKALGELGERGVPVAFLGRDYLTTRLAATHVGVHLFLGKPLDEPQLSAAVAEFGRLRRPPTRRVLLLSDEDELVAAAEARLGARGIETTALAEPWKVFHELRIFRPDLVLVDLAMPGVTGLDVCRMVRADPEWRNLPLVVAASSLDAELRVSALRAGADGCLEKPLHPDALLAQLERLLERTAR